MSVLSAALTFVTDPGHGWLKVPLAEIAALGIETDISPYSFINDGFAYLEEDADCAVYLEAVAARSGQRPEIRPQYVTYFDRNQARFGEARFSAAFWDNLRQQRLCPRCGKPIGAPYPIGCTCPRRGGG